MKHLERLAPDIRCWEGCGGFSAALGRLRGNPDVIVVMPLDIHPRAQEAVVVIARRRWPASKVLAISDPDHVLTLVRAGAHGLYSGANGSGREVDRDILSLIRRLAANEQRPFQGVPREFEADLLAYPAIEALTALELGDLFDLSTGLRAKDIAAERGYGRKTVRNRLSSAYRKLGARGDLDAVRLGRHWGFVPPR